MSRRFTRAFGAVDLDACEAFYDEDEIRQFQLNKARLAGKADVNRRRNPELQERERRKERELKQARRPAAFR